MDNEALTLLGINRLPPLIAEPQDSNSEDHRRNCLAWWLLTTKTRDEVLEWLAKQNIRTRQNTRVRLNLLREQVRELRREVQQQ